MPMEGEGDLNIDSLLQELEDAEAKDAQVSAPRIFSAELCRFRLNYVQIVLPKSSSRAISSQRSHLSDILRFAIVKQSMRMH